MDASLMFSASAQPPATPVAAPTSASLGAANPAGGTDAAQSNTLNGKTFAGLMRDLLPTHERQNVAAHAASDPSGLKSEALGAQLEVITASSAKPDAGSLTAFALAQGLDESAVMALFGEKPTPNMPAMPNLPSAAALSGALLMAQTKSVSLPTDAEAAGWMNMAMAKIDASSSLRTEVPAASGDLNPDVAWLEQNLSAEITVHVSSLSAEPTTPPTVAVNASLTTAVNASPTVAVNASPTVAVNASLTTAVNASPSVAVNAGPTVAVNASPSAAVNASPSAAVNASPTVAVNASLTTAVNASPSVAVNASPSAAVNASPSAAVNASPSAAVNASPSAAVNASPSAAVNASPTAAVNASPTVVVDASTLTTANWLATLATSMATAPTQAMAQGMPSAPSTELISSTLPLVPTGVPALASPITMGFTNVAPPNAPLDINTTASATASAVDDLIPLAPAPQDAMRIRLVPAWENVTQQLHQMSGSAMTVAWGALTTASLGAPVRSIALDLRESATQEVNALDAIDFSANTDNKSNSLGPDLNRSTATGTPLPANAQALPGMAQTERQAHYQQLADRLGQAMAERLQSQIARGEWKLQMRLNPASLGRIEVELDMHAKGLDAMFRSENPLTRELMAQSMPKLKDALTQSGMAVASVWVNSDAGRQSGGNPTPQREPAPQPDKQASAPADTVTKTVTKEKRTSDGFDVLA